jgi:hypothetical protein
VKCWECYFYDSQDGVYGGRAYCERGHRLNQEEECKDYINKKDKKQIYINAIHREVESVCKSIESKISSLKKTIGYYLRKLDEEF